MNSASGDLDKTGTLDLKHLKAKNHSDKGTTVVISAKGQQVTSQTLSALAKEKRNGYADWAQHDQLSVVLIRNLYPSHNFNYESPEFTILKAVTKQKRD